jgi:DNA-binding response OmpR family regulator
MKKKILVVDDEKDICDIMKRILEKEGYEVFEAYNGQEALSKVFEISPDMIIIDVQMPGKNGFEVCREIRKDPIYKELPVLMLTVRNSKEDRIQGFTSGVDEYMVKPFDMNEITARIKVVLERS